MNKIVIDSGLSQNRVAILENNDLVEYYLESKEVNRLVGNIYKGRVTNVLPGMEAAFIDIGYEKNAFLYVKDAIPKELLGNSKISNNDVLIKDIIKNGQEVTVQVIKEPIDSKGPRVSKHLTFPGRYLVLMPYVDYIGVSRRIEDEKERNRLKAIAEEIRPKGIGLIVRTEAENKDIGQIKEDLKYLLRLWNKLLKEEKLGFAPKLLYKDLDLIHRTLRDMFTEETEEIIINDKEIYNEVLSFVELISPHLKNRVKFFDPGINLFSYLGIEKMIRAALSKKVWLKSGGYIVIDKTEAMTVIDVNTGKYVGVKDLEDTIIKINKEAAVEISKQIRLRDIGGIIIIDFIDMSDKQKEQEIISILSRELQKDRVKTSILGITQLGLLEMTRKKVRNRISSILEQECPYCEGKGKVLSPQAVKNNIENELRRISIHTNSEAVVLEIHPDLYDVLNYPLDYFEEIKKSFNLTVIFIQNKDIHLNDFKIVFMGRLKKAQEIVNE